MNHNHMPEEDNARKAEYFRLDLRKIDTLYPFAFLSSMTNRNCL